MFVVDGLDAVLLTEAEAPDLQNLLERCGDYYDMVEGRPAGPNAAIEEMRDGPPKRVPQDLFCLGLRQDTGEMIGVISTFRHHIRPNQWYLSFFMLDPAWRGRALGRSTYFAFEQWVIRQGADSLLLAVVETNIRAARFWESLGFALPRCFPATTIGLRSHILIEYEKTLPAIPG